MCVQKLRDIDDPETVLCRAVLINNTFRTLKTAQRAIMRNARRRVLERKESSEEEEEEAEEKGEKEKGEEEEEISITSPPSQPLPSICQDSRPNFSESDLTDLCDVISETNSNSGANGFSFPKSDFGSCGGPSEAPDMFDTLLTEISQA